ncbi:MAG: 4-hydroxy-tetrahydrodipicolinate reductase [Chloroflexi bacterium]|nr:4-hydroxy-tetrahydrodipicolinate reductase [Chloroflexota bacterium]
MAMRAREGNRGSPTMRDERVRIAICGARGRMGQELLLALARDSEIDVVGGCDPRPPVDAAPPPTVPITLSLRDLLQIVQPDVLVDFTTAEAAADNAAFALARSLPVVIGTTGLTETELTKIDSVAREANVGALVAPNFAVGANLLMQFAKIASRFFDSAEVVEIHHDEKIDAPSGTAIMIAQAMRDARDRPFAGDHVTKHVVPGARGGAHRDLHIHSVRLPGYVATHEVLFGGQGQSLTIRHDSIGRDSFVPGVAFAVKHIRGQVGLVYGLDRLMGLT